MADQPKDEVGTRTGFQRYKWEFKTSNKRFWRSGHAELKLLSVICLFIALAHFNAIVVHPALTLLIILEVSIFFFFFIVYTFAIQRYLGFILWPISDLLNDLCCLGFLIGGILYAVQTQAKHPPVEYLVGVGLMGITAFFALVDLCLQRRHIGKKAAMYPPP